MGNSQTLACCTPQRGDGTLIMVPDSNSTTPRPSHMQSHEEFRPNRLGSVDTRTSNTGSAHTSVDSPVLTQSGAIWSDQGKASAPRDVLRQLLLQSYELVKKISKTNGVPAKEFVWALQADVECCEKIKRMFRARIEFDTKRADQKWLSTINLLKGRGKDILLLDHIIDFIERQLNSLSLPPPMS